MISTQRWLTMLVLCFSGGIIFMLPFLREVYYIPMQEAFGYSNTQMGVLASVFGAVSLLTYFPGGWLADRVSPRLLMSLGLLATGLAGFYFASFPSYAISIAIHAFWGACMSLVFWGAMIRATRAWAPHQEQGRAFGILESGRGIAEAGSSALFLIIFKKIGENADALSEVIVLYAITNVALAVATWFVFNDGPDSDRAELSTSTSDTHRIGIREVVEVLKMPVVWLISMVVLAAYSAYWGFYYFAPYVTEAFGLSVVAGATLAVRLMWIKPLVAVGAGFLADKIGVSRAVVIFSIIMTLSFLLFGLLPGEEAWVTVMLVNTVVVSIAIFALRGIYFALLDEGGIAPAVTGTAVGVISAVGFTPDVFMPLLGGILLDKYPGALGYQYFYFCIAGICAAGTLAAWLILQSSRSVTADQDQTSEALQQG